MSVNPACVTLIHIILTFTDIKDKLSNSNDKLLNICLDKRNINFKLSHFSVRIDKNDDGPNEYNKSNTHTHTFATQLKANMSAKVDFKWYSSSL